AASLIEEIREVDAALEAVVGGAGTARGSGGVGGKMAAAENAPGAGGRGGVARARGPGGGPRGPPHRGAGGAGGQPRPPRPASRKLWIAFALGASGRVVVDDGARRALVQDGRSLLPAGVRDVQGTFDREDAAEVVDGSGRVFAKGLAGMDAAT